jgi:HK97 family phage major capsid protein
MALRVLMLKKRIEDKRSALEELKKVDFAQREAELEKSIEEAKTDEERSVVDEAIEKFETEKRENAEAIRELEGEIENLEKELGEIEENNETTPAEPQAGADPGAEVEERSIAAMPVMERRVGIYALTEEQRSALIKRDDVRDFLERARVCIKEQRALDNVGLTIPEVMLPMLRQITAANSKLIGKVRLQRIKGKGRQNLMGTIPEGIWTEMCGKLNELSLGFNNVEVDGYKVGGFFAVCNAVLEDSDLNLANELLTCLGIAIAKALDKAIVYGTGTKMPLGIVTRLAQTSAPANYGATERTWADLHSSHVLAGAGASGIALFRELAGRKKVIKNDYFNGGIFWLMSQNTHTDLLIQSMDKNMNAAIVAGINDTMPVVGGEIIELDFIPDGDIVFGYGEAYLLVERAGTKLGQSEHYRFIEDQTVFKGTARYDGKPVIAEAFGVCSITSSSPTTSGISFAPDTANTVAEADSGSSSGSGNG